MFFHRPTAPSSLIAPSLFGLSQPHIYVYDPRPDEPDETETPQKQDGTLAKKDDSKPLVYRSGNVYIEETKDQYTLSFDLPGVKIQDVEIKEHDGVLQVTAERKSGNQTIAKFVQHFSLDETTIDTSLCTASLTDGVLTITAKKKEEPAPITVPISAADPMDIDENGLNLTLDVPGVKLADLKVEFHKGNLAIRGHRNNLQGQPVSKVNRTFQVNEKLIDTTKFQAYLMDGILTVTAASKPAEPAKTIQIPTTPMKIVAEKPEAEKKEQEEIVVETVMKEDDEQ